MVRSWYAVRVRSSITSTWCAWCSSGVGPGAAGVSWSVQAFRIHSVRVIFSSAAAVSIRSIRSSGMVTLKRMGRSFQVLLYHRSGFDRAAWSRVLRGRTYQVIRRCRHTTGPGIGRYRPSACASPAILTGGSFRGGNNPMPRGSATPPGPRRGPGRTGETAGGPRRCTSRDPHLVPGTEGVTVGRMTPLHLEGLDGIRRAGRPGRRPPGGPGGCGTGRVGGYPFEEIRVYLFEDRIPALHPGSKMPVVENAVGPGRGSKPGFVLVSRARVFGVFPAGRAPRRGLFGAFQNL